MLAAASLTDAFTDIATVFEAANPGVEVALDLAGSQQLVARILEGAPADVFASASPEHLDAVARAVGLAGEPVTFAENVLEIAVEPGNPARVEGLADLARDDLVVVLAAPEVPAGRYAAQALDRAGVDVQPASLELDVRAALGKVAIGEADAAVVYRSDVRAAGHTVEGVRIADAQNVVAQYPIAVLADAPNPIVAREFLDAVLDERGRAALIEHGFSIP